MLVDIVTRKCQALKRAGLWASEPQIRPAAWLGNFELEDQEVAAALLDRFTYCNDKTTNLMLKSSWQSLGDNLPKGPSAPSAGQLVSALNNVVFTPVEGERPNPTDSGNFMCRKARQELGIPDDLIMIPAKALERARGGAAVVFLDDFVGSGDQFIETWKREYLPSRSFESEHARSGYIAIYLTLITTDYGLQMIHRQVPTVAVCPTHIVRYKSTLQGLIQEGLLERDKVSRFLRKYSAKLRPTEGYIMNNPGYLVEGYKNRGLLLGFEHSIPDATLPIFWSPGIDNWEPLIERV